MFEKLVEMALSGVVGNFTYDKLKSLLLGDNPDHIMTTEHEVVEQAYNDPDIKAIYGSNIYYINRFKTFDLYRDFEDVLSLVKNPVVHIVIEDKPSSAWHLPLVVLEDSITSEWYIFSKGRMAFEGSGGGLSQSRILFKKLLDDKIHFAAWVVDQILSDKLSQGCRTWQDIRPQCVPLLTYNKSKIFTDYILTTFKAISIP